MSSTKKRTGSKRKQTRHASEILAQLAEAEETLRSVQLSTHAPAALSSENLATLKGVMQQVHELMIIGRPPVIPEEGADMEEDDEEVEEPFLVPTLSSLFSSQKIVNVISCYLLKSTSLGRCYSADAGTCRLLQVTQWQANHTFSRTIETLTYICKKQCSTYGWGFAVMRSGYEKPPFTAFPCFNAIRITGHVKGVSKEIELTLGSIAEMSRSIKKFCVQDQVFGRSSMRKVTNMCKESVFDQLVELRFESARVDHGAIKDLASAWRKASLPGGFLPCLRVLSFNNNEIGDLGMVELIEAWEVSLSPVLQVLDVRSNQLTNKSLMRLVDALERGTFPRLKHLSLETNRPGGSWTANKGDSTVIVALAGACERGAGKFLEVVDVCRVPVNAEVVDAFVRCRQAGGLPRLKTLSLHPIEDADIETLQEVFGAHVMQKEGIKKYMRTKRSTEEHAV